MSTLTVIIPDTIRKHLQDVINVFGLESNEDTMNQLINGWLEKEEAFKEQMFNMGMEETGSFDQNDERGVMALTYSGSLISIGPLIDGLRKVDYTSIGFRQDVPETLTKVGSALACNVEIDKGIHFTEGPIKQTSPVYKIVVCPESLSSADQEDLIDQATTMVIESFAGINQETLLIEE